MDWLGTLEFQLALKNVHLDVLGDWYRDPWGWAELDWLVPTHLDEYAVPRLNAHGVKQTARLDVAKENFAVRPAVVLDPLDRLLYQALVDALSVRLIGSLSAWAYGWRLDSASPKRGRYVSNEREWEAFRGHLTRLGDYDTVALTTDIVSFFASIPPDTLSEQILAVGHNRPAERLVDMVLSWYRMTGRGLPQRSAASASLAHMYLAPLDEIIDQFNGMPPSGAAQIPEGRSARWMDDIWIFGRSAASLREAQISIQSGMRDLGLEMNFGKTAVLYGDALTEAVFELEHSAVDGALADEDDPDVRPLESLVDRILFNPETADRTSIRFMATRMRKHELFDRVGDVAETVERMPQGADHLARLFRDSEHWRDLQDWYTTYAKRWHGRLPWTVAQLGTMFPTGGEVGPDIVDFFKGILESTGVPLPLLSVAAQRVAAWDPSEAKTLIRALAQDESRALAMRSLALAALHAGATRNNVRRMLQQNEENELVLAMLEDTNFAKKAVPVGSDYA
jgi:hypothetical protein